ncbi:MAG: SpoIVB peptidase, partial [Sporomusa sp.]
MKSPATDAGFQPGDIIVKVNSSEIDTLADFRTAISNLDGGPIAITVKRGESTKELTLTPAKNKNDSFELGLWLRDGMAGIGTVTFYDPQAGVYGALGHSVSDIETGLIMPLDHGNIMPSSITGIMKGEPGTPGELQGEFDFDQTIGSVNLNTDAGIFGLLDDSNFTKSLKALPVGFEKDINLGEATILANIEGKDVREYSVEISKIFTGGDNRKMMVTVTDENLLAATGGIVQGMSGSPIIQNGKIIGAVTHVLVNNPEKGYGISMDSMLGTAYEGGGLENAA